MILARLIGVILTATASLLWALLSVVMLFYGVSAGMALQPQPMALGLIGFMACAGTSVACGVVASKI